MTSAARMLQIALVGTLFAAVLGLGSNGAQAASPATPGDYVPFVTDFPEPVTTAFVPFVTDFPQPAASPDQAADPTVAPAAPGTGPNWFDWADLSVEGSAGAALAALLAGAGLVVARRAWPARRTRAH
jgi:hypothetical protein